MCQNALDQIKGKRMASTLSPGRCEFSDDLQPTEPSIDSTIHPADLNGKQPASESRAVSAGF
jgi:hypothetical protein